MLFDEVDAWLADAALRGGGVCLGCRYLVAAGEACATCTGAQVVPWRVVRRPSHFLRTLAQLQVLARGQSLVPGGQQLQVYMVGMIGGLMLVQGLLTWSPVAALAAVPLGFAALIRRSIGPRRAVVGVPLVVPADTGDSPRDPILPGALVETPATTRDGEGTVLSAWQVRSLDHPHRVVLRHVARRELLVRLDDGRLVIVPAGPVRVLDLGRGFRRVAIEGVGPVPLTQRMLVLEAFRAPPGTRLGLQAELAPVAAPDSTYREAPGPTHRVIGVPTLRLLPPA